MYLLVAVRRSVCYLIPFFTFHLVVADPHFSVVKHHSTKLQQKLYSSIWIIAAIITLVVSDFFRVILFSEEVNRWVCFMMVLLRWYFFGNICRVELLVSVVAMGAVVIIAFYYCVYLPCVRKVISSNIPRALIAVVCLGILCSVITFNLALWPVYGFLTPSMLLLFSFALVMLFNFVPSCKKNQGWLNRY